MFAAYKYHRMVYFNIKPPKTSCPFRRTTTATTGLEPVYGIYNTTFISIPTGRPEINSTASLLANLAYVA